MLLSKVVSLLAVVGMLAANAMAAPTEVIRAEGKGERVEKSEGKSEVRKSAERKAELKSLKNIEEVNNSAVKGSAESLEASLKALTKGNKGSTESVKYNTESLKLENIKATKESKPSRQVKKAVVGALMGATVLAVPSEISPEIRADIGADLANKIEMIDNKAVKADLIEQTTTLSARAKAGDLSKAEISSFVEGQLANRKVMEGDLLVNNSECLSNFKAEAVRELIAVQAEVARNNARDLEEVVNIAGEKLGRDVNDNNKEKGMEGVCLLASNDCKNLNAKLASTKSCTKFIR